MARKRWAHLESLSALLMKNRLSPARGRVCLLGPPPCLFHRRGGERRGKEAKRGMAAGRSEWGGLCLDENWGLVHGEPTGSAHSKIFLRQRKEQFPGSLPDPVEEG